MENTNQVNENNNIKVEVPQVDQAINELPQTKESHNFWLRTRKDICKHIFMFSAMMFLAAIGITAIILSSVSISRSNSHQEQIRVEAQPKISNPVLTPIPAVNESLTNQVGTQNNVDIYNPQSLKSNDAQGRPDYPVKPVKPLSRRKLQELITIKNVNMINVTTRNIAYNGQYYSYENDEYAASCDEYYKNNRNARDGIYRIQYNGGITDVYCFMKDDGGWIGILARFDNSLNFAVGWDSYVNGFGSLNGEYWLGLETMNVLTANEPRKFLVSFRSNPNQYVSIWNHFRVKGSSTNYALEIKGHDKLHSSISFDFMAYANGIGFSAINADHDTWNGNCAAEYVGGWWYTACHNFSPTGRYGDTRGPWYGISLYYGAWIQGSSVIIMMK